MIEELALENPRPDVIFGAVANAHVEALSDIGTREFFVLGVLAVAVLAMAGWHANAVAQGRRAPAREAPKFEVDPSWPKIPNGWVLGQVSGAATGR